MMPDALDLAGRSYISPQDSPYAYLKLATPGRSSHRGRKRLAACRLAALSNRSRSRHQAHSARAQLGLFTDDRQNSECTESLAMVEMEVGRGSSPNMFKDMTGALPTSRPMQLYAKSLGSKPQFSMRIAVSFAFTVRAP
jgi:hypothetical protein